MNHLLPLGSHETTGSMFCCLRSDGQGRCFFERSTSTCVIREFKIPTTWTAKRTSQFIPRSACFPSKKLTTKIYKKRLTLVTLIEETLLKKTRRKPASGYKKKQVDLQTLQFFRSSGRNLKTVFPTLCNTTRQLHA